MVGRQYRANCFSGVTGISKNSTSLNQQCGILLKPCKVRQSGTEPIIPINWKTCRLVRKRVGLEIQEFIDMSIVGN